MRMFGNAFANELSYERAALGAEGNSLVQAITNQATEQAKLAVKDYLYDYYQENQAVILLSAVAVLTWVVWVSTRRTN